jgi:single stranded DNA-binding protein
MANTTTTIVGNLTDNPEIRYTQAGIARARFRVAVSGQREQEPSFFTVIVWRDQAEHAAQSLAKGSRVVIVGRLQQRSWTAEDGSARSVVEVVTEELGRACGGRRRPRPGRRQARANSHSARSADMPKLPMCPVRTACGMSCCPARLTDEATPAAVTFRPTSPAAHRIGRDRP